jgi:hypothetical protein
MGILDDAIREHLDLKRRRGADPAEVERAEREALGPVRRNPNSAELAEAEAGDAPVYEQAGDADWSHDPAADAGAPPVYDDVAAEPPVHAPPEFPASESGPLHDVHDPLAEDPFEEEPSDGEPAHEPFPAAPAGPPAMGAGPETAEYNVEDALAAEEPHDKDGDDDVLEETPEFLQDTPDHDRLWFEQRPPKDFDFDE